MKLIRTFLALFFLLAFCPIAPVQATAAFDVNSTTDLGDNNPGDCICRNSNNTCSLRAAVEEANACSGDNDILLNNGATYILNSKITINPASGSVSERINISVDDPNGSKATIKAGGDEEVILFGVSKGELNLSNLTLRDSNGIQVSSTGSLSINRVQMVDNHGGNYDNEDERNGGGAIEVDYGSVSVYDSQLTSNTTIGCGGAINNNNGSLSIYLSVLSTNSARHGGAVCNYTYYDESTGDIGGMGITQSELYNNTATEYGGAIFAGGPNISYNTTVINLSILDGNQAAMGGGIYLGTTNMDGIGGGITVINSTLSDNLADRGAGIANNNASGYGNRYDIYIENSTISGNAALIHGGGVYMPDGGSDIYINSSTITNNSADREGDNAGNGAGIYNYDDYHKVYLENTIVAGNNDLSIPEPPLYIAIVSHDLYGKISFEGFNLIGKLQGTISGNTTGSMTGTTTNPLDPKLGPLAPNGYFTPTHPLLAGSPAIDMGDPTGCKNPEDDAIGSDQRGEDRHVGWTCDIGAYESSFTAKKSFLPMITR